MEGTFCRCGCGAELLDYEFAQFDRYKFGHKERMKLDEIKDLREQIKKHR